jgi:hypothetical protein
MVSTWYFRIALVSYLWAITTAALNGKCYKLKDKTLADILPKIWANLSWNFVDLIECNQVYKISYPEHKSLLKESTKHDVSLRFRILNKEMETIRMDAKVTFLSSCEDDHRNLTAFLKNGKSFSILVALTRTDLIQNFFDHVRQIKALTLFYLLDMERQVIFLLFLLLYLIFKFNCIAYGGNECCLNVNV